MGHLNIFSWNELFAVNKDVVEVDADCDVGAGDFVHFFFSKLS